MQRLPTISEDVSKIAENPPRSSEDFPGNVIGRSANISVSLPKIAEDHPMSFPFMLLYL